MKALTTLLITISFGFFFSNISFAQTSEHLEGRITKIEENTAEVVITSGEDKDITVEAELNANQATEEFKVNDKVVLQTIETENGQMEYFVSDYVRKNTLWVLFIIFAILSVLIGGFKGISSLAGLAISFLVIFKIILPFIDSGYNPLLVTILSSILIVSTTFYLSHGFSKKTTVSVIGTIIALTFTGILALVFLEWGKITGAASEEVGFLQIIKDNTINVKDLILAGIIIGTLGILDDITISQAAIVKELSEVSEGISTPELFTRSMNVGKDHIASLVNTLILVYTGSFLPLLLLFTNSDLSITTAINYEVVAEEIIRMLVSSIGLILAVPITTLLAILVYRKT